MTTTAMEAARTRRTFAVLAFAGFWLALIIGGMVALAKYSGTSGQTTHPPTQWPDDVPLSLSADRQTLVMFAHPHCPCTRASMGELERLMARAEGKLAPWIVFYKPSAADAGWEQTDLWRSAERIPDAHVLVDRDGTLATRFHAATSGQALVYDPHGKLLFQGGITPARGHAGDNEGENAILRLLRGESPASTETPTFGCPIVTLPAND